MTIDYAVERILAEIDAQTPDEHWIQALDNGTQVLMNAPWSWPISGSVRGWGFC